MNKKNLREKYTAIFLLHALGDTIGFKNLEWEFNYFSENIDYRATLEIVFDFISLGGYSGIDLKGWYVSDDTLLHMAIGEALLEVDLNKDDKLDEESIEKIRLIMEKRVLEMKEDENKEIFRGIGKSTLAGILNKKIDIEFTGSNGAAMRTLCIGAVFHKEKDLDKLIEYSIKSSKITHKIPLGFLGGLSVAYFVSLALNNEPIENWVKKLIKLVSSQKIKDYIDTDNVDMSSDYNHFLSLWNKYYELRFKNDKPVYSPSNKNLVYRTKFFYDFKINYEYQLGVISKREEYQHIGGTGVSCVLMAYDALLDSGDSWEKLIYYAMLHVGDSDTVGAVAGGLFGALYGMNNIPEHMLKYLEKKKELEKIAEDLYDKFN